MIHSEQMDDAVREQFRLDTNCSAETENEFRVMINESRPVPGARLFAEISPFFRAIIYLGEMYMMCDDKIIGWAREKYGKYDPAWFCLYSNLRELDAKLQTYGFQILDTHDYFLPDPDFEEYDFECPYRLKWFGRQEILDIKGSHPFRNAVIYAQGCPDEIAVAALDNNSNMIAMAGASSDGKNMWQIGVDVLDDYRHKGLGVYLVTVLKDKILDMGKIPFYGTSESHTISKNLALKAGFVPSWCEVYSAILDNSAKNV